MDPAPQQPEAIDAATPSPLKQIRTYQGDVANAIHDQQESLVSIRTAEKARADLLRKNNNDSPEDAEGTKKQIVSILLLLGGLILLGAAGTAGWFTYQKYLVKTAVPVVNIPLNRFLPVTSTNTIDTSVLTRESLVSLLNTERSKPLPAGNIEQIELRKGVTDAAPLETPTQFMLKIEAQPSGSLVRALDPLFMLGVLGQSSDTGSNQTFLLMKLDSYDNAYAGMLEWEKNMSSDLLPFFQDPATATTTPITTGWSDITIKNKDARVMRDAGGKIQLIYSFYNQNLLIITASEGALRTIMAELDTQALAR